MRITTDDPGVYHASGRAKMAERINVLFGAETPY